MKKYLGKKVLEWGEDDQPRVGVVRQLTRSTTDDKKFKWVIKFKDDPKSSSMDESDLTVALEEYEAYEKDSVKNTTSEKNSKSSNDSHVDENSGNNKKLFYLYHLNKRKS